MTDDKLDIKLRPTAVADLDDFFQLQLDSEAIYLAAFTPKDPNRQGSILNQTQKVFK